MIRKKSLRPRLEDITAWFRERSQVLDAILQMAAQGHLCRISESSGQSRFEFRHDRFLEYQLSMAAFQMLGDPE